MASLVPATVTLTTDEWCALEQEINIRVDGARAALVAALIAGDPDEISEAVAGLGRLWFDLTDMVGLAETGRP